MIGVISTGTHTTGFGPVFARLAQHRKMRTPARLQRAAMAGAKTMQHLVTSEMLQSKSGIQWPGAQGGKAMPSRSSSPSEMPAVQSAELIDSMEVHGLPSSMTEGVAALDANSKQAWFMEFGFMTKDGGFHIRPFMRPGREKFDFEIRLAMRQEMRGM